MKKYLLISLLCLSGCVKEEIISTQNKVQNRSSIVSLLLEKIMRTVSFLSFIAIALLHLSCEDPDRATPANRESLLTDSRGWKPTSMVIDNTNDNTDNGTEQIRHCDQDNLSVFMANGSGNINHGTLRCATEQNSTFTWEWQDTGQTRLRYQEQGIVPEEINILSMDANEFRYSFIVDASSAGGTYTKVTVTAKHP